MPHDGVCEVCRGVVPAECEVCGKRGKAADKCAFEHGCSCWYGVPCVNGESIRKRPAKP